MSLVSQDTNDASQHDSDIDLEGDINAYLDGIFNSQPKSEDCDARHGGDEHPSGHSLDNAAADAQSQHMSDAEGLTALDNSAVDVQSQQAKAMDESPATNVEIGASSSQVAQPVGNPLAETLDTLTAEGAALLIDQIMLGPRATEEDVESQMCVTAAEAANGAAQSPKDGFSMPEAANSAAELPQGGFSMPQKKMDFATWRQAIVRGLKSKEYDKMTDPSYDKMYSDIAQLIETNLEKAHMFVETWYEGEEYDDDDEFECNGDDDELWMFWQRKPLEKLEAWPEFLSTFRDGDGDDAALPALSESWR